MDRIGGNGRPSDWLLPRRIDLRVFISWLLFPSFFFLTIVDFAVLNPFAVIIRSVGTPPQKDSMSKIVYTSIQSFLEFVNFVMESSLNFLV